ncbi:MAG: S8 family serine peptidase [Deltaproteobacteria bacterium]|nr:S8 family serine peptidase [Deltaproteobacteria bacterium]
MYQSVALLVVAWSTLASPQAPIIAPILLNPPAQLSHLHQDPMNLTVRFDKSVHEKNLNSLRNVGAQVKQLPSGRPVVVGHVVSITIPKIHLQKLVSVPGVVRVESAIPTMYSPPLYDTSRQIQATQIWSPTSGHVGTMGEGITIADLESAWDIFHPDYFRPDGGYVAVKDSDGNGIIGAGDTVDLDGDNIFESTLSLFESGLEDGYQPDLDWLYIDENKDGKRNYAGSTVTDETPAFGEPIFIGDDINRDGVISGGEKLVRLGSSKVAALYDGTTLYKRGDNLSRYPRDYIQENIDWNFMSHGTGAAGIAVSGWPGLRRHTGIAPAADLVLLSDQDKVAAIAMSQELGADVVFHEWNDWQNFQDGSTNIEAAVTSSAQSNQVQVAPAGNLANAAHILNIGNISQTPQIMTLSTDNLDWHQYSMFNVTFTWRGEQSDIELGIRDEDRTLQTFTAPYSEFVIGDMKFQSWHDRSERGTAMVQLYASRVQGGELTEREWNIEVTGSPFIEKLRGVLLDDRSGWGQGVSWLTHVSDNGSALSPSTADTVIAVAAHGGVVDQGDWGGAVGYRRAWSGMGPRIDGEQVIDISSPDDPIVCASLDNDPSFYGAYSRFGGTSGATPHVAGIAALMLGSGSFTTHLEIEAAMTNQALMDEATGEVPNEAYGYGKIRGAASLYGEVTNHNEPSSLRTRITRNAACALVMTLLPQDPDGDEVSLAIDMGYTGVTEVTSALDIALPQIDQDFTIVIHATDAVGTQSRQLSVISPADYSCTIETEQTSGCNSQNPAQGIFFIAMLLSLAAIRQVREYIR